MAVAVKNASEATPGSALDRLSVSSLLGVLYVLGSLGIVFYAVPALWSALGLEAMLNPFVVAGLQVLAMVAAAGALLILAVRLVGPNPPAGLRAGVGVGFLGLIALVGVTWIVGAILEASLPEKWHMLGAGVSIAVGAALFYYAVRAFFRPEFEQTLVAIDEQGWFSRTVYKGSQGQRVRRGTMVGVLILIGCGIYTLVTHNTLVGVGRDLVPGDPKTFVNDWIATVPFTEDAAHYGIQVSLLRDVRFTVPILIALVGLWVAFRMVNFPVFADFLIATEAEMNKVSWSTRKRLWQDTIVVLVTLVLFTVFLMAVDLMWGFVLTRINILSKPPEPAAEKKLQPW